MDNRLFNVNGCGDEMLKDTLSLAFKQADAKTASAWVQTKEQGLILLYYTSSDEVLNKFPSKLTVDVVFPIVKTWLTDDFAKTVTLSEWCQNLDHDGHNSKGWQVYCGDWGHVGSFTSVICAIKPAYMWHGK